MSSYQGIPLFQGKRYLKGIFASESLRNHQNIRKTTVRECPHKTSRQFICLIHTKTVAEYIFNSLFQIFLVLFFHDDIFGHSLIVVFQFYKHFNDFEAIRKRKFPLNTVYLEIVNFLMLRYLWTVPWQENMHDVRKLFKYYSHIKFQVNISNGSRVLEALPPKTSFR